MPNDNASGPSPEDVSYPETLRITIQSAESAFDDALDAAATAAEGNRGPAVVAFENTAGFRRILTDRRLDVIRSLMHEPAESISHLAERLGRSYSTVHEDVEILAENGVVKFRQSGQAKQPFVPYETIEFDVTIRANRTEDDSEARA